MASAKCPQWHVVLVWTVGLIFLAGLMANEFLPLIDSYRNNNVAAQVIIRDQAVVKPPSVVFCIPRSQLQIQKVGEHFQKVFARENSTCEECDKLASFSWNFWRQVNFSNSSCVSDYWHTISETLLSALLRNSREEDFEVLHLNNSNWNQLIVHAVWDFFACTKLMDDAVGEGEIRKGTMQCFTTEDERLLLSRRRKMDTLFRHIAEIACEHTEFFDPGLGYLENDTSARNHCIEALNQFPSAIDDDDFCFALPVTESGLAIFVKPSRNSSILAAFNDTNTFYSVFTDQAKTTWGHDNQQNTGLIYQSRESAGWVSIGYLIANRVIETREGVECYKESTPTECEGDCMVSRIIQLCRCVPFTFRNSIRVSSATPYCTLTSYADCFINKTEEQGLCRQKCTNPCDHAFYEWRESHRFSEDTAINITIKPISSPYIEFTISVKNSREQFLTQIGAVFNFYLGFSGLYLISGAIYVIDLVKARYASKKRRVAQDSSAPTVSAGPENGATRSNGAFSDIGVTSNFDRTPTLDTKIERLRQELKTEMERKYSELRSGLWQLEKRCRH